MFSLVVTQRLTSIVVNLGARLKKVARVVLQIFVRPSGTTIRRSEFWLRFYSPARSELWIWIFFFLNATDLEFWA